MAKCLIVDSGKREEWAAICKKMRLSSAPEGGDHYSRSARRHKGRGRERDEGKNLSATKDRESQANQDDQMRGGGGSSGGGRSGGRGREKSVEKDRRGREVRIRSVSGLSFRVRPFG